MKKMYMVMVFFCLVGSGAAAENIAVLTLQNNGGLTDGEIMIISEQINYELSKEKGYKLVERQRIDEILKEQGFQQSGACSDKTCLVEVGQLLAVEKILSGSVGKIGNLFSINLKIIDVGNGEIVRQISRNEKTSKENLLSKYIPMMVKELAAESAEIKSGSSETPLVKRKAFWIPVAAVAVLGGGIAIYSASTSEKDDDGTSDGLNSIDVGSPARPVEEPW